jgi:outer membrane protein OmpA-like peptidoglycan-associated protein
VLADVQNAIVSGKQVELIAMTDHLGTGVQNAVLAERRAAAASEKLQTLGIPKEAITIRTYQSEPSENATPMERISNRTVRIRIRD